MRHQDLRPGAGMLAMGLLLVALVGLAASMRTVGCDGSTLPTCQHGGALGEDKLLGVVTLLSGGALFVVGLARLVHSHIVDARTS